MLSTVEYTFDAKGKILGRLASDIAKILMGKNKATYAPNRVADITVRVDNTDAVAVTGSKPKSKEYFRHSGRIGNLKQTWFEREMTKDSRKVLYKAVWNMLPKNRLRKQRMKNLKLYRQSASR